MCGIAGFWDFRQRFSEEEAQQILRKTTDFLRSRGPDAAGYYYDGNSGLAFGHRRLSIVDLTEAGAQPMCSANGRYIMTYNGEIYNTQNLRELLAEKGKTTFRGHSDTEILIEIIDSYGIAKALELINGLFAFAVYDKAEDVLYPARDHIGIKPLYWAQQNGCFFFASTITPIMQHNLFEARMNGSSLADYFSFNTIPAPQTILQDCFKLRQGHYLTVKKGEQPLETLYWKLPAEEKDYQQDYHTLLSDAVRRQMVSDVPLGVFLSGGVDSSLLAALMQECSDKPIQSFTIGFEESSHNEAGYAAAVAQHLGTNHRQEILSVQKAKDIIVELPDIYDEPFADSSQLPSVLLCGMARKHVTVCLSGDGGDELFAGYNRYFYGRKAFDIADKIAALPLAADFMSLLAQEWLEKIPFMPPNAQTKLIKLAMMAKTRNGSERNKIMVDLWVDNPSKLASEFTFENNATSGPVDIMRRCDMQCYLPDDILHKMDRASMANSLEVRVPYLDKEVCEAAFKLSSHNHYNAKAGKIILRDILRKYVPDRLIDRPKAGFSVPVASWLRSDLDDLTDYYFASEKLEKDGLINVDIVRKRLSQHKKGTHNWQHSLWGVLMLQMWREKYKI